MTEFRDTTLTADLNGSLFPIWGGDVKLAIGAEYRKSSIDDQPDPNSIRGNLQNFSSTTPTVGSDSVYELYGELQVPLLKDLPFAKLLTVDGSARYTRYKSYGGQSTYKVGALWRPANFLSFRGSYGTSYRAPALFEQFLGASQGFLSSNFDPCDGLAAVTNPLVLEQCLADGLPADFVQNGGVSVFGVGGAEAGLKAETSKNLTFGSVLQHNFGDAIGAFSFAADYFRIKVDNGVAQLSVSSLLDQCYESPQRTLCGTGLILRAPYTGPGTGGLTVIQSYVNIATSYAKGIDFVANYTRRLGPGTLSIDGQAVRMLKRYDRTLPTSDILDVVGFTANPKWAGSLDAQYKVRNFALAYGFDYIHGTSDNDYLEQFGYPPETYDFTVDSYMTHRASVRYETKRFALTLGVRNMFDKQPPKISTDNPLVNTTSNVPIQGGYDFLGRTFFANVRASF
jgi:outer membrane receptor protein involved in Fe transport